jgi:high-affinity iron transporter
MNFIFKIVRFGLLASIGLLGACARPTPPVAPDRSDAQRLVAVVDYIAGDYGQAVRGGRVVSPSEYEEQLRFAAGARTMATGLIGSPAADDALLARLAEVEARVRSRAEPEAVAMACRAAREEAVARFGLKTVPAEQPSLERAQRLYAGSCATCHGSGGDADTERARTLDPPPFPFRDQARLADLSPYRVYNALTFGVPGTAMASFEALSPSDRWSLAFYVFRLGHDGDEAAGPVSTTLADMALRTDREVVQALRAEGHPAPERALAHLRREAAFAEVPAGVGIDRTRALLRRAAEAYARGGNAEADGLVLDAYLEGFEPLEPRLRSRDASGTLEAEQAFHALRGAIARGAPTERVRSHAQSLDRRLLGLAKGPVGPGLPAAAAFVIYLREGLEAALLVGALLAAVRRTGRPDAARHVHAGWLLALPAGVVTWWLLDRVVALGYDRRELVEAGVGLAAAAVLFSVSFWMISKAESRRWVAYLQGRLTAGLGRGRIAVLFGLAFLAVYREAAETVLFTHALMLESPGHRAHVFWGSAAGLLAVAAAAFVLNRTVLRLPLGPFFAVSGALLCALAASFAGSGIYALVAAGYLTPRPVSFPEVPWMGIHADLTVLVVQLLIVLSVAAAGVAGMRRRPMAAESRTPS